LQAIFAFLHPWQIETFSLGWMSLDLEEMCNQCQMPGAKKKGTMFTRGKIWAFTIIPKYNVLFVATPVAPLLTINHPLASLSSSFPSWFSLSIQICIHHFVIFTTATIIQI
jgi:hypothetical protein